jgi:hypothetical protein
MIIYNSLTYSQKATIASIEYSDKISEQVAFRAGTTWAHPSNNYDILSIIVFCVWIILQFIAGFSDGSLLFKNDKPKKNKWRFIFPLYTPLFYLARWMTKESE